MGPLLKHRVRALRVFALASGCVPDDWTPRRSAADASLADVERGDVVTDTCPADATTCRELFVRGLAFSSGGDLRALRVVRANDGYCDTNDCKAVIRGNDGYCQSGDCKAILRKNDGYCETDDCKAFLRKNDGYCQTDNCKAFLRNNDGYCR